MTPFLDQTLEISARALLVALLVGGVLRLIRVRAPALRHAAWTTVLGAMLLMPVLPRFVPALRVPVPFQLPAVTIQTPPRAAPAGAVSESGATTTATVVTVTTAGRAARATGPDSRPDAPAAASLPDWRTIALAAYLAGLVVMLASLGVGWRRSRALLGQCRPVESDLPPTGRVIVVESAQVATPVSIGSIAPRIVLPIVWRSWPEATLRAVLAHESAHVRRRDPLVGLLARVNRAIFWFHPLAWWLERTLAAAAEQACDDEAVVAVGRGRPYAEVLLDMAETVRRNGGRLAWQGVGVNGGGRLGERIERVLRADVVRAASRWRKGAVATGCVLAIGVAIACQRQVPPLRPDPQIAALIAQQDADSAASKTARELTADRTAVLMDTWRRHPDDLDTLETLLLHYSHDFSGKPNPDKDAIVAIRRPLILWLIEHHPESPLAGSWGTRIFPSSRDPLADPAGYAQAKALWLSQAEAHADDVAVLRNAATFLEVYDRPLAEDLLLKVRSLDPKAGASSALGRLYAITVLGSNASMPLNVVRSWSLADAHSAYADTARQTLADSADPLLLTAAANYLRGTQQKGLDFDPEGARANLPGACSRLQSTIRAGSHPSREPRPCGSGQSVVRPDPAGGPGTAAGGCRVDSGSRAICLSHRPDERRLHARRGR